MAGMVAVREAAVTVLPEVMVAAQEAAPDLMVAAAHPEAAAPEEQIIPVAFPARHHRAVCKAETAW